MNIKILENRINRVVNLYDNLEELINNLPISLPDGAQEQIKKMIFGNKDINNVISSLKDRRPPRFFMVGRTGVGKSSLINAILGKYAARTSPIKIGTNQVQRYNYESDGRVLFEVMDTRGIAESTNNQNTVAEDQLKEEIEKFDPDAVMFLTNATERARMDEDVEYIKQLYKDIDREIPLVTVITHVDNVEPSRIKENYTDSKIRNINEKKLQMENLLKKFDLNCSAVIPVSAYIEWNSEDPHQLDSEAQKKLHIEFDGRYNIEALLDFLETNMDFKASVYLMMMTRVDKAIKKIADKITSAFAAGSAAVGISPIPFSDMAILIPLQLILITTIAYLSGTDISKESAKEFLISFSGIGIFGYGLRVLAQQGSKLLNLVLPIAGSAVSSVIAFSGTLAIGKGAIAYYIDKKSKDEVEDIMKEASKDGKDKFSE